MRSIVRSRNIDAYNSISKNQLIRLITTGNLWPSQIPAFEIEQYVSQLSKRELKDFIYYNYDYSSSKTNNEVDRILKNTQ